MNGAVLLARVKSLCKQKGISIHKLEHDADIGNGIIAKWADAEMPSLKNIRKVADYFDVTIAELLKEE